MIPLTPEERETLRAFADDRYYAAAFPHERAALRKLLAYTAALEGSEQTQEPNEPVISRVHREIPAGLNRASLETFLLQSLFDHAVRLRERHYGRSPNAAPVPAGEEPPQ